jgi:hypothetical protein
MQPFQPDLAEHLKLAVGMRVSGLDIIHSELKNLMYEAELQLEEAKRIEEANDYSDAMESMDRKYWEGHLDALGEIYELTYQLSFAIADLEK